MIHTQFTTNFKVNHESILVGFRKIFGRLWENNMGCYN